MTKWDRFRGAIGRAHDDFEYPTCEFQNFNQTGITNGNVDGSYEPIGAIDCEFVPPGSDSTVDTEGTHLDFSTSVVVPNEDLDELLPDKTYTENVTIPSSTTESYDSVVVESGVTLTVDGRLIVNDITINGSVDGLGNVDVFDQLPGELIEYGDDNKRPTKVIPQVEQNVGYELQAIEPADGSGLRRLRLIED